MNNNFISGVLVDPISRTMFGAKILIKNGTITDITRDDSIKSPFILPGMVDSHVHIESSMLTPTEFSFAAAKHGTIAAVCDPHEIANVAGVSGVDFMLDEAKKSIIKLYFGVPSSVPASPFDECFQPFTPEVIHELINRDDLHFLGEMMNFPGVVNSDENIKSILESAIICNKPIDGHAPALSGDDLKKYVLSGISTDHECFTIAEANEKIALGMKVLIREGSAAKNYNQLKELIDSNPNDIMFCTDDCHPDDLLRGHINKLMKKSVSLGYNLFNVLQATSVNPIKHYGLKIGLLQKNDSADFIVVDNLSDFNIISTYINGYDVLKNSFNSANAELPSYVFPSSVTDFDLNVIAETDTLKVIGIIPDELVTDNLTTKVERGKPIQTDLINDILKIVVISRYEPNKYSVGFIKGVGLNKGAIAASIAHDSHHIISIGTNDNAIHRCISYIFENKGGVCYYDNTNIYGLPLPVFGLMSNLNVLNAATQYEEINNRVLSDGCKLKAPFMTMAFMSLSVIPKLKITPSGLFDVSAFNPTSLFE